MTTMHKFEPANKKKLDSEWRRQNLPPRETLEHLGLKHYDTVADIGCGIGYFLNLLGSFMGSCLAGEN